MQSKDSDSSIIDKKLDNLVKHSANQLREEIIFYSSIDSPKIKDLKTILELSKELSSLKDLGGKSRKWDPFSKLAQTCLNFSSVLGLMSAGLWFFFPDNKIIFSALFWIFFTLVIVCIFVIIKSKVIDNKIDSEHRKLKIRSLENSTDWAQNIPSSLDS